MQAFIDGLHFRVGLTAALTEHTNGNMVTEFFKATSYNLIFYFRRILYRKYLLSGLISGTTIGLGPETDWQLGYRQWVNLKSMMKNRIMGRMRQIRHCRHPDR